MRTLTHALLSCWVIAALGGCSATLVNHTATTGATATDLRFVDGDATTHGVTQFLDGDESVGASAALVTLSAPRVVTKLVVHSPDLLSYEVFVRDPTTQEWVANGYHQGYAAPANMRTAVRLKGRPLTDAVLLRVVRTTEDHRSRTKTLSRMNEAYRGSTLDGVSARSIDRGRRAVAQEIAAASARGDLQGVATIHEIELFGPAEQPQ
ncbi:hypothetical protein HN371_07000 [Candidatus Poribacteria bacterium]|nr:hypothetical protein [Candidatus Poribacteria bacterium]MBT5534293.1 hypothetical protein [Candidatus Poribacteria bacterium]MBT5712979.1 hypothetical protein [Candidatus Poribacteria bacterium]MBT7099485.1 hypothetical protein [Candidatus Poribacteria bacterium]MBT7805151.1 hypothetical protein [Candidatus Poribacteria bacterium]